MINKLGILFGIIGAILFMICEIQLYFSRGNDFEHELTKEELDLQVTYYLWGFISILIGMVLLVIGNLYKRSNKS